MALKLPKSIASAQDLAAVSSEIRRYSNWYNHEAIKQRVSGKAQSHASEQPISAAGSEIIRSWFGPKKPNRSGFDSLIKQLDLYEKNAKNITVTLAAPAPASLKATLVEWFRENVSSQSLVSFRINSTILGGMVVQYGSRVFDWSFRRQIIEKSANFAEVIRRV